MNRVQLIGNLGVDPVLRKTEKGKSVANFTMATNRTFTDAQGKQQQRTEWHRIVVWGKAAEACAEFLQKGRRVFLEGSMRTRQWEDKDGVKRYTTEVYTNYVDFLGGGKREDTNKKAQPRNEDTDSGDYAGAPEEGYGALDDEEPPF